MAVPFTGAVPLPVPGPQQTAQQTAQAFRNFVDSVAQKVGVVASSLTCDLRERRVLGFFHGLSAHVADRFEAKLDKYQWTALGPGQTAGQIFNRSSTELNFSFNFLLPYAYLFRTCTRTVAVRGCGYTDMHSNARAWLLGPSTLNCKANSNITCIWCQLILLRTVHILCDRRMASLPTALSRFSFPPLE